MKCAKTAGPWLDDGVQAGPLSLSSLLSAQALTSQRFYLF